MKSIILNFPKQFKAGLEKARGIGIKGAFNDIIICGVGGSALPGSLLLDAFGEKLQLPVYIHRSYGLPKIANAKSLIICISFSGNTEETLSAYQEAIKKNYQVIAITTNGKLQTLAKSKGLPVVVLPNDCSQPRLGSGYLFSALIGVLTNCGISGLNTAEIARLAKTLKPAQLEERGKKLADKIAGKTPIIYCSAQYKAVGRIWKIKFNENSKILAFWNYFPELNHNEMAGLSTNNKKLITNNNFYFLILKDRQENPQIIKRMEITAKLIKEAGVEVEMIEMQGKTRLEKIFHSLLLADWTSYYLAFAYGIDPLPVKIVEEFKKRLAH